MQRENSPLPFREEVKMVAQGTRESFKHDFNGLGIFRAPMAYVASTLYALNVTADARIDHIRQELVHEQRQPKTNSHR